MSLTALTRCEYCWILIYPAADNGGNKKTWEEVQGKLPWQYADIPTASKNKMRNNKLKQAKDEMKGSFTGSSCDIDPIFKG